MWSVHLTERFAGDPTFPTFILPSKNVKEKKVYNSHHMLVLSFLFLFLKKILFIYLRENEREWQRHRQREKQAPGREPDVGLDSGSPGSGPGLKAVLNR